MNSAPAAVQSPDSSAPGAKTATHVPSPAAPVDSIPAHHDGTKWPYWVPRPSTALAVVLAAALVETIVLSWTQWDNLLSFLPSQGDLGDYNQAFFNTISGHGVFYYTTNIPSGSNGTALAVHFSPTFFALLPLYAVAPAPITLLILKQAALAFAAVPLFGLAKVYFRRDLVPTTFALLYLVSPLTTTVDWNNVDPESFLPITLLFALYFFARGRFWPYIICWILALGTIEAAPPLMIIFAVGGLVGSLFATSSGSYWSPAQQRRPLFVGLAAGLAALALGAAVLYAGSPRGGGFGAPYARRYSVLGATSVPTVVSRVATHPTLAVQALQFGGGEKVVFLLIILVAPGIVWLFGGLRYLFAVGGFLFFVLLANVPAMYSLGAEYTGLVSGFLFAGAIEGAAQISVWLDHKDLRSLRARLRSDLAAAAQSVGNALAAASLLEAQQSNLAERWQLAKENLGADRLGVAEEHLRYVAARLGMSPPTWASCPNVLRFTQVSPEAPGAYSGQARRRTGLRHVNRSIIPIAIAVAAVVGVSFVSNPWASAPLGGSPQIRWGLVTPGPEQMELADELALIPDGASVLTTGHLFPQLSSRHNAFVVPSHRYLPVGETIEQDFDNWANQSSYVAYDYNLDREDAQILVTAANLSGFGVLASSAGGVVLERGYEGSPVMWTPFADAIAGSALAHPNASISSHYSTGLGQTLYHAAGGVVGETLWQGPSLTAIPFGNYSVSVALEIRTNSSGNQLRLTAVETPAYVNDTPEFTLDGETYHEASVHPETVPSVHLGQYVVSTQSATSGFVAINETFSFTIDSSSYLSFPATLLSTDLSVYLVSLDVVQITGLG